MAENKNGRDLVKEIFDQVTEDVIPVVEELTRKAKPVIDDVMEMAEPATREVRKRGKKAAEKAMNVGGDIAKEAAKRVVRSEMFLQFGDYELRMEDVESKAREDYVSKGHKASGIKSMQIYIKPEDHAAYYVVNHETTGRIDF